MSTTAKKLPWTFLDEFRGKDFYGEWPTFPEMMRISVKRFADSPFLTAFDGPKDSKTTLTFAQTLAKVEQLAKWMIQNGIKKGDKIAVMGKNSPQWAVVYHATFFASGIIIPIDNGLHESDVVNIVKTAEPSIVFCDDDKKDFYAKNFPNLKIMSLNPDDSERYVYNLQATSDVEYNPPVQSEDIAAILFTSGTTGNPKGVVLSHKNLIADGFLAQLHLEILHSDVFYALLPIHHAYTMQAAFICPLEVGAEIVFGKSLAVSKLMKELREGKISIMLGVPLLYNKLLFGINNGIKAKGPIVSGVLAILRGLSFIIKQLTGKNVGKVFFKAVLKQANIYTLRVAICGGGPLAPSVFKQYNAMGIDFIQGYGLTETSPIIALNPIEKFKIESVGADFYPYAELKISEPQKTLTSSGWQDVGEIVVKGPMVMQGYYNRPEDTAKMFTEDGYLRTGDLGWMDKDRYVMLCGRAKNLIVTSGGKNVYPEEIEDGFQLYDDVQQVTVRGYYDENDKTSEQIEALIYPSDGLFNRLGLNRSISSIQKEVVAEIKKIVSKVNKNFQAYSQITKISLLKKPLEMTTSQKVKRNLNPEVYDQNKDKEEDTESKSS